MINKVISFVLFTSLLVSPLVNNAQYDETGNLITITADNSSPLVYRLPNGLTVILYSDNTQPHVTGMVVALAGGKNDPPDATGLAHYMEHMLFKGTTKLGTTNWVNESKHIDRIFTLYDSLGMTKDPAERKRIQQLINEESLQANEYAIPNELDKILKEIGSTGINAGTGPDYTVYYNIFPRNQIERWLEIYSHRFMFPVFRSFQAELEVVYEEKNMYSDMFAFGLFEEFNKSFYKVHPYGQQPLVGTIDHLKNPSLTKMKQFYEQWYVANNMALIMTGDFDISEILPLIQQSFGALQTGPVPEKVTWVENPFNGREYVEKKLSPIKIGLLGYRIPPNGHPDKLLFEVVSGMLNNSNQTGLFDKLTLENKLLGAAAQNVHYGDYGTGMIIFVPKVAGQSLSQAEQLILDQIDRLRKGNFSDTLFESVKLNLYRDKVMALESSTNLAYAFLDAFASGTNPAEVWNWPQRVRDVSREDVIRAANQYFGDNFLAFHSKMGVPKKEKIEKPGYEPVVKKQDEESDYYRMINELPEREPEFRFVDFDSDIQKLLTDKGVNIYKVDNPKNDIFTLNVRYGIGEGRMPVLKYVSGMMNLSGAAGMSNDEFSLRMAMLGCTYHIWSDDSYLTISLTGLEENLEEALILLNQLVQSPNLEQSKLKTLYSGEKASRKMERKEPDMLADALYEYVLYGQNSSYLDRLTMKQLKKLKADTLVAAFKVAVGYAPDIHYAGRRSADEITELFVRAYTLPLEMKQSTAPFYRVPGVFLVNEVYVTPKKKAVQSKVFFHATLMDFNPGNIGLYNAFNTYFGGGFSGIVLQEIREYRSMAYAAGASLVQPPVNSQRVRFSGYVGTQADKTNEAVDVFVDLMRTMPQKPERMTMIKRYIVSAAATSRPGFRSLSQSYVAWKHKGFDRDPSSILLENVPALTPYDLFDLQKQYLANTPVTIIIAGNTKKFSLKDLEKHGKVHIIKEKKLFSK